MKKSLRIIVVLGVISLFMMIIAACGASATGPNQVHMNDNNQFSKSSITIKKGQKVTLVNDGAVVHVIENGTWQNNNQKLGKEPGAPTVDVSVDGFGNQEIGPFTTAGTFNLICTVHPGMKMTVIVE